MNKKLNKFKQLLEYFVAHLEYIQAGVKDSEGYKRYIEPIVQKGAFKKCGQGYNGAQIQNQISKWQDYGIGRVCINIQGHYGNGYFTKKCYLNWASTGINIIALWNNPKTKIQKLGLTEYIYWEDDPYYVDSTSFSISDLGLYDGHEPNETIKDMYRQFSEQLINIKTYNMTEKYQSLLMANKNLILHGAPGTGKTYLAKNIATQMILHKDKDVTLTEEEQKTLETHIGFVQFHPSMDYTDFVEGLRPFGSGEIGFRREDGIFKAFCKRAIGSDEAFVFIIDEINRGDMSKIFGELFFSLDPGYRGKKGLVKTQYQNLVDKEKDEQGNDKDDVFKNGFFVPKNVYVIGTMNDIDRSVESMDFAMRRRFAFKEISAARSAKNMLNNENSFKTVVEEFEDRVERVALCMAEAENIKNRMANLNDVIVSQEIGLTKDYQIGAAYFLKFALYAKDENPYEQLWRNHIEGVLKEYLRGTGDEEEKMKKLKAGYDNASAKNS